MQVSKTAESPTHIKLVISAAEHEMEPIKRHALNHFKSKIKVPGFRAGTAPQPLIEKYIDQKQLIDEFLEHALNHFYRQAINGENIRPATQPQVQLTKFVPFSELEFSAELDVVGNLKLAEYKNIRLPKPQVRVEAAEVTAIINDLAYRAAERIQVKRAAKAGDEVIIDFKGTDKDGRAIQGAEGKEYALVLGSNKFIPGFEDKLTDLKAGDKKKFSLKLPKDYGVANLQNKDVTFDITVKKVNQIKKPKLDDKFAAGLGPFKTLADFKKDIKQQLLSEKRQQTDQVYENALIQKIVEGSEADIPEKLIDEELERAEAEEKRNLIAQGQTWQEHLKIEGLTEEEHRKKHRPAAENRVKTGLILSEIIERENPAVDPSEVDLQIQILKGQYQDPVMQAQLDKPENRREIEARLKMQKVIQKLKEHSQSQNT